MFLFLYSLLIKKHARDGKWALKRSIVAFVDKRWGNLSTKSAQGRAVGGGVIVCPIVRKACALIGFYGVDAAAAFGVKHSASTRAIRRIFQNKAFSIRGNYGFLRNEVIFAHAQICCDARNFGIV